MKLNQLQSRALPTELRSAAIADASVSYMTGKGRPK